MKRGEIYLDDLSPRCGSEQCGIRPAIILTHDAFNQAPNWLSIIVVPVSSSATQASRGPTVVRLPQGVGDLANTVGGREEREGQIVKAAGGIAAAVEPALISKRGPLGEGGLKSSEHSAEDYVEKKEF